MNLAPVINLLRQRIGLDAESLGPTALVRAITARMKTLNLSLPSDYATRLETDAAEFQLLIDGVAVRETWFFRGGKVFDVVARHVAQAVQSQRSGEKIRILSVPCSTGEEPYSLAIALVEFGVPAAAWQIDAVDLSARHIEKARRARFSEFSFRQTPPDMRQRYFLPVEGRWELDAGIRSLVRFRQGNLLDPLFLASEGPFDLIFCRNLFIYLHADARRQALDTLHRLLHTDGLLCTGHAEPLEYVDPRFTRAFPEGDFLYRLTASLPPNQLPARQGDKETRRPGDMEKVPVSLSPCLPVSLSADTAPVDLLTRARQQADGGQLDAAFATCQLLQAQVGPSADLFSLTGVIHQARHERAEAFRCYQRALYLEHDHADAMTHLMLLYREQGDHDQAERLRRRLERVAPGGES